MKKSIYLIFSILFLISCTDDISDLSNIRKFSQQEIKDIAIKAYFDCFIQNSRQNTKVEIKEVLPVANRQHRSFHQDTLMYVVNFEDDLGFAIVSSSPYTTPLLGISDQGNYDPSRDVDCGNFEVFMTNAENYVTNAFVREPVLIDSLAPPLVFPNCPPKLHVSWGQEFPYGKDFRNGTAGCSNIATAQIMSYFKYPQTMVIKNGKSNYTLSLDWDEICLHKKTDTDCNEHNATATHNTIGAFIRQIGRDNFSDDTESDATYTDDINALRSLHLNGYYCSSWQSFSFFDYKNYLDNDYLVYLQGYTTRYYEEGHDWIMDGYKVLSTLSYGPPLRLNTYCHYNWGADGRYNGYFLDGVFCVSNAFQYDNETGSSTIDFRYDVRCSAVKPN